MRNALLPFIILFFNSTIYGQNVKQELTLQDDFKTNNLGWFESESPSFQASVSSNSYQINYDPSDDLWYKKFALPEAIQEVFKDQEDVELSFNLQIKNRNGFQTTGIGFTFDISDGDYNLLYIGEENGFIFSSIIPRRGAFKSPIKDGRGISYRFGSSTNVKITKKLNVYQIYLNDVPVLNFFHRIPIVFSNFYLTAGSYEISNLKVYNASLVLDKQQFDQKAKAFDPTSHQVYLLLTGVSNYSDKWPKLNSPVNDISALKMFWKSPAGGQVPDANIYYLPDQLATHDNIIAAANKIALKATGNDVVIAYFSGHGLPQQFCCADSYLSYQQVADVLNLSKAKNKLFIIDACFAGSVRNIILAPGKGSVTPESMKLLFAYGISVSQKNTSCLSSCSPDEISEDGTLTGNSEFTKALLVALKDPNGKYSGQLVTLKEAFNSLSNYFRVWNSQNYGRYRPFRVNGNELRIPVKMNPQLTSLNGLNDLPLSIIP